MLRNKSFVSIVLIYSVLLIPFYAYTNMSAFIYVNLFGCSEQTYSYYYAANKPPEQEFSKQQQELIAITNKMTDQEQTELLGAVKMFLMKA